MAAACNIRNPRVVSLLLLCCAYGRSRLTTLRQTNHGPRFGSCAASRYSRACPFNSVAARQVGIGRALLVPVTRPSMSCFRSPGMRSSTTRKIKDHGRAQGRMDPGSRDGAVAAVTSARVRSADRASWWPGTESPREARRRISLIPRRFRASELSRSPGSPITCTRNRVRLVRSICRSCL